MSCYRASRILLSRRGLLPNNINAAIINSRNNDDLSKSFSSLIIKNNYSINNATVRSFSSNKKVDKSNTYDEENKEWLRFQQSIQVKGFDTGQPIPFGVSKSSGDGVDGESSESQELEDLFAQGKPLSIRGGKQKRKARAKLLAQSQGSSSRSAGTERGLYPAERFSEEETQRLLEEAYAGIPPRAGPRRSRAKKRMRQRFWRMRRYHAKKKRERIRAHFRRQEKQKQMIQAIRDVRAEAPEIVEETQKYQQHVLDHYAKMVNIVWQKVEVKKVEGAGDIIDEGEKNISAEGEMKQSMEK